MKPRVKLTRGIPPIHKTVDRFFESVKWNEFWDLVKKDNPIVFVVVKKRSGEIEKVLIKKSIEGQEFNIRESKIKGALVQKIIEPTDEEIMREIGVIQNGQEPLPPPPESKEVDVNVGDKIIVNHDGSRIIVEIVELYPTEGRLRVKMEDGKEILKDASEFVKLA